MNNDNTSGFYKNDNGFISYGQNYVLGGSYNLYKEEKDNYTYPINGWYWFDSEEKAYEYFNIKKYVPPPISFNGFPYPENI